MGSPYRDPDWDEKDKDGERVHARQKSRTQSQVRAIKREQAEERQAAWDQLTTKQKLKALDRRFGVGHGAKKQRAKLLKALAE